MTVPKPITEAEKRADKEAEALALMLYDNSSEIKILPSKLLEPAIIISKILVFENVDAYAVDLIRQNIKSYHLGGDDIEEDFKKYLGQFVDTDSDSEDQEETSTEEETDQAQEQQQQEQEQK